jgi:N-carbamoylputrescine amidase
VKNKRLNIGLVQMTCSASVEENHGKALSRIREAAARGANIICLQELYATRYFCDRELYDNFDLAVPVPGAVTESLQALAGELKVVLIASLFEKLDSGIFFNTAAVIDADGSYLGKYRKNHIPDDPGYYEKFYFSPGDNGYQVFNTKHGRMGVLICWDQWYPEAARITSLMGAQILFYPTAIGWAGTQSAEVNKEQFQAWLTIQRSHAIANGVHVVAVNRTGHEEEMQFWGGSFVANPFGTVIYQAPHDKEEVGVVPVDLGDSDFYRTHWPFMRDRRIDTYQPIVKRYIKS